MKWACTCTGDGDGDVLVLVPVVFCVVLCCWSCVSCRVVSVVLLLVCSCVLDCHRCVAGCVPVAWCT